jgi:lactoylglutathione lyase
MALLDLAFTILYVDDMERATGFYRDVVGLPLAYSAPGWVQFGTKGAALVLHPKTEAQTEAPRSSNLVHPVFPVDDLEAEHKRLTAKQVKFNSPPPKADSFKHATFVDSEGNEIDLLEWKQPPFVRVTADSVVNDVIVKHPETMQVFENHGIRICGGCLVLLNAPVYETAEYSGLDAEESSALVGELNERLTELESPPPTVHQ